MSSFNLVSRSAWRQGGLKKREKISITDGPMGQLTMQHTRLLYRVSCVAILGSPASSESEQWARDSSQRTAMRGPFTHDTRSCCPTLKECDDVRGRHGRSAMSRKRLPAWNNPRWRNGSSQQWVLSQSTCGLGPQLMPKMARDRSVPIATVAVCLSPLSGLPRQAGTLHAGCQHMLTHFGWVLPLLVLPLRAVVS